MPYSVSWVQPERIVLVQIEELLTTADIRTFSPEAFRLSASGKAPVHFIVDIQRLRKIESVADGLKAIQRTKPHPNTGWMVVVGTLSAPLMLFTDLVSKFTRVHYIRVDTMPQALTFLRENDESLAVS
jgi:hypothetical protein